MHGIDNSPGASAPMRGAAGMAVGGIFDSRRRPRSAGVLAGFGLQVTQVGRCCASAARPRRSAALPKALPIRPQTATVLGSTESRPTGDGPGRWRPELIPRTGGVLPAVSRHPAQPRKSRVRDSPDRRRVLFFGRARIAMPNTARLLERVQAGDALAARELLPAVYDELRRLARLKMAAVPPGHTLQPTALVHEAWLRLAGQEGARFESRTHFFTAAAEAMRRILVERARRRLAAKRGGAQLDAQPEDVEKIEIPQPAADDTRLLAVHEALEKFAALAPRKAELVKLRYFVGMTFEEAAEALGIAVPTAKQWWAYARAWLTVELSGDTRFF